MSKTIFAAFLLLGIVISPVSAAFPDVSSDHIYSDAINYVQENRIVNGFNDGTFKPEQTITRAEFTKIIVGVKYGEQEIDDCMARNHLNDNLFGVYREDVITYIYSDVYPDVFGGEEYFKWTFIQGDGFDMEAGHIGVEGYTGDKFAKYICMAKEKGVVGGYSDGTFRPDNLITVGEASKIISNAYGFTNQESGPTGNIFKPFVDGLVLKHAMPVTIHSIVDNITRGQMVEIIWRLDTGVIDLETTNYRTISSNLIKLNGTCSNTQVDSEETNCYISSIPNNEVLYELNPADCKYGEKGFCLGETVKLGKKDLDSQFLVVHNEDGKIESMIVYEYFFKENSLEFVVYSSKESGTTNGFMEYFEEEYIYRHMNLPHPGID